MCGEFSYDGEDVEAYYKEDDDYVTASTYVKRKEKRPYLRLLL